MSGAQARPALAKYRDAVAVLIEGGEAFGDVEHAIDTVPDLSQDQKAALWLFAFSMRDPTEQRLDARATLYAVQ
jgi:hypothetical protein